jgi:hypothetical protein
MINLETFEPPASDEPPRDGHVTWRFNMRAKQAPALT